MLGKGRSGTRIREIGQKGFTLIELLIVVAILGALAAIVIPNVGRFIGRGETEAKDTEFANIQSAVVAMMVDNELATLPNPVDTTQTRNMSAFPDTSPCGPSNKEKDIYGNDFSAFLDKGGYILYGHDRLGDNSQNDLVNYVATANTSYWYTVDTQGTVTQHDTAPP
jgi:prepilin-type N-terminal cleavage/methylation domain-containing protein